MPEPAEKRPSEGEPSKINPIRETDSEALALARELSREALGALSTIEPETGFPAGSRIALIFDGGDPVTLVSDLSHHTKAMGADARCSVLLGTPPAKGDPLAFPRVTVFAEAQVIERKSDEHGRLREAWLAAHPKAALYIDFGDFRFWRLAVTRASLNGGFGKAYELTRREWMNAVE